MKVAVVTWGSRGDFQPYLALSVAMRQAGHEVRLGSQPLSGFAELAAEHGVNLVPLAAPAGEAYARTANAAIGMQDAVRAVRLILDELFLPAFDEMYGSCLELARWSDVMISHFLQTAGAMAAESAGTPWVTGTLVPTQVPTAGRLPGNLHSLGGTVNSGAWKAAVRYMNRAWLPPINQARSRVGLPALDDVAARGFYSPHLNLIAVSPQVFPRPADWPPQHRMTGFWLLNPPKNWQPPAGLADFLELGPTPIAIGFGSMTNPDNNWLTQTVQEAVRMAGVRAVIDPGMAGLGNMHLPDPTITESGAGHAWLLPRVAALVHHGGIGTAASAFHAGIPSVFVPHVFDQFTWARRARRLGVAPAPVPMKELAASDLAKAITRAVEDETLRKNARGLSERLRKDGGVVTAVKLVEELLARGSAPAPVGAT